MGSKLYAIARLMRLDRPIGIYLLLWPTLWALFLAAEGTPPLSLSIIFVLGVVIMRSAGCVINDYADRHFDGHVERTQARPIVSGELTEKEALTVFTLLILCAFILVLLLNWQTVLLSSVALLLAASYPFMKRFTHYPQVVLGAAFGWSIPMASMAVSQTLPQWVWILFIANLAWTVAYDTYYAMVDKDDDLKIGVKSTAIAFGQWDLRVIALLQLVMIVLMALVFEMKNLGWIAYGSLVLCCVGFFIMHFRTKHREKAELFKAFLDNHYIGLILFVGISLDLIL